MPNDLKSDPGVAYSCENLSYYSIVFGFLDELIWIAVVCGYIYRVNRVNSNVNFYCLTWLIGVMMSGLGERCLQGEYRGERGVY